MLELYVFSWICFCKLLFSANLILFLKILLNDCNDPFPYESYEKQWDRSDGNLATHEATGSKTPALQQQIRTNIKFI